eukprot:m51a1_g7008 putative extracellular ligand-binding receptor protein (1018) ;mRNA; r:236163-239713
MREAVGPGELASSVRQYEVDLDNETGVAVLVVGQSAPFSGEHAQLGVDVRAGIEAAFALANETSLIKFALTSLDDQYDDTRQQQNINTLLCTGANGMDPAFAIAGTAGSSASEAALSVLVASEGNDSVPVPYVGGLTSSELLRVRSAVLQNSTWIGLNTRTGVVLTRPGAGDEISSIVSLLSGDWDLLNHTGVFYQTTSVATASVEYLSKSLISLSTTLRSSYGHAVVSSQADLSAMAQEAVTQLYASGAPKAIVLLATGKMCGALMKEMARQQKSGVTFVAASWVTAEELYAALPSATWATLLQLSSQVYISQVVPNPTDEKNKFEIINQYKSAMAKYRSSMNLTHASLEGFMSARLLTLAANRALDLYGWPLTRSNLLDTIFRDVRTFSLHAYTLGPYGDGIGSYTASQNEDDWCNQGAHELFMTTMNMTTGLLTTLSSWSFKFTGCRVLGWNSTAHRALVGFQSPESTTDTTERLTGLSAAIGAHNGESDRRMALTTILNQDFSSAFPKIVSREVRLSLKALGGNHSDNRAKAVAIAAVKESDMKTAVKLIDKGQFLPLIAPRSGLQSLRRPFKRVVNLFASYYQEARTAAMFLIKQNNASKINLVWNRATHNAVGEDFVASLDLCRKRNLLGVDTNKSNIAFEYTSFTNVSSTTNDEQTNSVLLSATPGHTFIVVAPVSDAWSLIQIIDAVCPTCSIVLTNSVDREDMFGTLFWGFYSGSSVYRTSLTPLYGMLSSKNTLRQDFENWVTYSYQLQTPFEGFVVGKFISAVLENMDDTTEVSAETFLNTIYTKKYFKIDNVMTVGPFLDQNSGERLCNQGMDTVYMTQWGWNPEVSFHYIAFSIGDDRRCGMEFDPDVASPTDNTDRTVILSTTIPGFAVVCSLILVAFAVQRRGRATLKKIKRSELEIGERIGKGQFGTVHNGDWHGTPVAIRVIDKTDITREDLSSLKSEMMLTSSLHHPNLLMMLGYSESNKDLLIVSEYMASGSLHEYLKKNKQNMNFYNQVAIAFVRDS